MNHAAIILFAHGARDPAWAVPFEAVLAALREHVPERPVLLAYLELMPPSLADAVEALVAEGVNALVIWPLFLAPGSHVQRDLPREVAQLRALHPDLAIEIGPVIGSLPSVQQAIVAAILQGPSA